MSKKLLLLITFVLVLGLSGAVQADPCDANLIGWWQFDEGDGNTVADSSAYNNYGVSVSPTPSWGDGSPIDPCNSGMDFDGWISSDYVVCAERDGNNPGTYPAELMPDEFTISCWTKLDSFVEYGGFVSNGHEDAVVGFFLNGGGNGNNFGISMGTVTGWWDVETPTIYYTDRWYHLAATYDGQDATVYVDGELAAGPTNVGSSIKWQADNNDYPSNFVIGSWKDEVYTGAGLPVDGIIDDVRFYDYAMDVNDILVLAGIVPGAASNPNPRYGARDVSMSTKLSWTAGTDSNGHDVYFGTDETAVEDANTNTAVIYRGPTQPLANVNYDPNILLDPSRTYYWRIDEVNDPCLIKGRVWSFTTGVFLVVDDFDSYVNYTALRVVWTQYELAELFVETDQDLVIDGNSMRFYYRNRTSSQGQPVGSTAEADTVDLEVGSDWTARGVKALVVNFRGDTDNGLEDHASYSLANDRLWVSLLEGSNEGIVRLLDMNDVTDGDWHEWNISLQDPNFSGVDMNNIAKVYIGFGGVKGGANSKHGAGIDDMVGDTVWFDDIRLYPPRCRAELVAADFTGDCITDHADVWVMSDDWLDTDSDVMAMEPCDVNLIGWWKFDEGEGNTVEDSSAYNNNGATESATPTWVTGHPNDPCNSAMDFPDSFSMYNLVCAERVGTGPGLYPAELMPDTFTIALWTKLDAFGDYAGFVTNGSEGEAGFFLGNNLGGSADEGTFMLSMHTDSSDWQDVMPANIYVIDTWYHIAVSYDGQYANFYVDGIRIEGPQDVGTPITWVRGDTDDYTDNFVIGAWEDPGWSQQLDGTIDEVRYYDYALQAGEVAVLAGLQGTVYVPLDLPTNLVPKDPCDSADPNLGTDAFDPNNLDIVNFLDYRIMANSWLDEILWP